MIFQKILKFINKETSGLHQAAYLLGLFSIASQVLGLLRDRLLATTFGAGHALDIYYASFRIPDFIFITVGSMVSVSVLIPFLVEKMKSGEDAGKKFINNIFLFFFLIIVVTSTIVFIFLNPLSSALFPGFNGEELNQLVALTRVMLLSPIFLGLSNIFGTLTQTYKRFLLYALCPILYNGGIIVGILFFYPIFGLIGLVYGVILGSILHFAIQIPFIIENKFLPKLHFNFNFPEIKKVLLMSIPRTLTLASDSISVMFLLSFASLMTAGSIAIFNFSYNLESFLLTAVGVSYSLAAFPVLIKLHSEGKTAEFSEQTVSTAKHVIFWSIPIATLFIILRVPIVQTILGAGQFNQDQTNLTAAALAAFVISIACQNLTLLFVRAYYAVGNTLKPFIAKFLNALTTILLGYLFMKYYEQSIPFQQLLGNLFGIKNLAGAIVLTLPLGWSVGEILNTIALWFVFERDFRHFSKPVLYSLLQVVVASAGIGLVAYIGLPIFGQFFNLQTSLGAFLQGFCAGMISIFVGIGLFILMKNSELLEAWKLIRRKIFRQRA